MLAYFKECSLKRSAWFFLALVALGLEATGLYFQHGLGLQPCVMCVYERLAILGLILWGFSAIKGLLIAIRHTDYQLNPSPWNQCEFKPDFPQTMPFDQWFPSIFSPGPVNCSESQWQMLGWGMPQWLILAFSAFTVFFALVLLSQFKRTKTQYRSVFK